MNENYIMLNGKRIDLTDEQIKKIALKVNEKDYFNFNKYQTYYFINSAGAVNSEQHTSNPNIKLRYNVANYCTDHFLMQQRAYHETLNRLLWRFSMQNDGNKIDWSNDEQRKYYIYYDHSYKTFYIDWLEATQSYETYYYTEEIAQRAIDEIIRPFMKEHPDFVW